MLTLPLFHCRTTLQSLYQSTENARVNNYYVGGLSHTWMSFYLAQLTDDCLIRNEWYVRAYSYPFSRFQSVAGLDIIQLRLFRVL